MSLRLENKIAVITGGGRGIGGATAKLFADEGAWVVIAEIDAELADETAREIGDRAIAVSTDVTNPGAVAALFAEINQRFGKLDILVCNAGRPYSLDSLTATEDDWEECLNLNLRSAWLCSREAQPLMQSGAENS